MGLIEDLPPVRDESKLIGSLNVDDADGEGVGGLKVYWVGELYRNSEVIGAGRWGAEA